jgi:transposase-like protein
VEIDETYLGRAEKGVRGRQTHRKPLIAMACEEQGKGIGRIRLRHVQDASAKSLMPFIREAVEPASVIHTDGWLGYEQLEKAGYIHKVTFVEGQDRTASELFPRVHQVASLLKRWLLGTHQGAVSEEHLDYYLDEFTFRFNRRRSSSRGLLFRKLLEQAVEVEPAPYRSLIIPDKKS